MQSGMYFPPYGDTIGSIVVKHINGQLVDVLSGKIYPACVNFYEGKVVLIEHKVSAPMQYLLPGLIDSRVHIESSSLTPYRFAEQAVAHGTTAVIADPTPVAAAMGMDGIRFLMEDGRAAPLRFYYAAPSSLPASTGMDWRAVRELLGKPEFVALGEITEVADVLGEETETLAKMEVARQYGKPIDGFAPGLHGYDLDRYIMTDISSDHGCTSVKEAMDKQRRGMTIIVEEGAGAQQLDALSEFMKSNRYLLATGDLGAPDIVGGHMDELLRRSVALGVDPVHAIRAATLWPAERYNLAGGSLYVGGAADLTVVNDLKEFKVLETWIGGEQVAKDGTALFLGNPVGVAAPFRITKVEAAEVGSRSSHPVAHVRVLEVNDRGLGAGRGTADLAVQNERVMADPRRDIALLAWVDPWRGGSPKASFVKGFGLTGGALATSYVMGAAGILGVGTDAVSVADAMNMVLKAGGGKAATQGGRWTILALPEGGMMSSLPAREIGVGELELRSFVREMGSQLPDPLLSLSYLGREVRWAFDLEPALEMRSA
jgi:adenine deaminase